MPYIEAEKEVFRESKRTARRMHSPRITALCDNIVSRLILDTAKQASLSAEPEGEPYSICGHIVFVDLTAMHALALVGLATEWARVETAWRDFAQGIGGGQSLTRFITSGLGPTDVLLELQRWAFYPKTEAALLRVLLAGQPTPFNVRVAATGPTVTPQEKAAHPEYLAYLQGRWEANLHETPDNRGDLYPRPYHLPPENPVGGRGPEAQYAGWNKHALTRCFQRIAVINGPVLGDDKDTSQIRDIGELFNGRNLLRGQNSMLVPEDGEAPKYDVLIAGRLAYEGVDLQKRTCAIHHLDGSPWTPAVLTQRNGRAVRQGNLFDNVSIYSYLSDGSVDYYRLNRVRGRKAWLDTVLEKGRADVDIGGNGVDEIIELQVAVTPADQRAVVRDRLKKQYSLLQAIEQRRSEAEILDLYAGLQGTDGLGPARRALLQRFYSLHLLLKESSGARDYGAMLTTPPRFMIDGLLTSYDKREKQINAIEGDPPSDLITAQEAANGAINAAATTFQPVFPKIQDLPNINALYASATTQANTLKGRFEQSLEGWHKDFFSATDIALSTDSDGFLSRLAEAKGFVEAPKSVLEDAGTCVQGGFVYKGLGGSTDRLCFVPGGSMYIVDDAEGVAGMTRSPATSSLTRNLIRDLTERGEVLGPLELSYEDLSAGADLLPNALSVPPIKTIIEDADGTYNRLCPLITMYPPKDAQLASAVFLAQTLRQNGNTWPTEDRVSYMESVQLFPTPRLSANDSLGKGTIRITRTDSMGYGAQIPAKDLAEILEGIAREGKLIDTGGGAYTDTAEIRGRYDDAIQAVAALFLLANPYTQGVDPSVVNGGLEMRAYRAYARTTLGQRTPDKAFQTAAAKEGLEVGDLFYPGFMPRMLKDSSTVHDDGSVTFNSITQQGTAMRFRSLQDFYDKFWDSAVKDDGPRYDLEPAVWGVMRTLGGGKKLGDPDAVRLNRIAPPTMEEARNLLCLPHATYAQVTYDQARSPASFAQTVLGGLSADRTLSTLLSNYSSPSSVYKGALLKARNASVHASRQLTQYLNPVPQTPTQRPLALPGLDIEFPVAVFDRSNLRPTYLSVLDRRGLAKTLTEIAIGEGVTHPADTFSTPLVIARYVPGGGGTAYIGLIDTDSVPLLPEHHQIGFDYLVYPVDSLEQAMEVPREAKRSGLSVMAVMQNMLDAPTRIWFPINKKAGSTANYKGLQSAIRKAYVEPWQTVQAPQNIEESFVVLEED